MVLRSKQWTSYSFFVGLLKNMISHNRNTHASLARTRSLTRMHRITVHQILIRLRLFDWYFFLKSLLSVSATTGGSRKIVYTSSSSRPLKTSREEEKTILLPLSLFTLVQSSLVTWSSAGGGDVNILYIFILWFHW